MKKNFFAIISILGLLSSCQKETNETDELYEISFNVTSLECGGTMTRAATNDEVISDIEQCMPTFYELELKNISNGNTYSCKTGESIRLPQGTYEVKTPNKIKFFSAKHGYWFKGDIGNGCGGDLYTYFISTGGGALLSSGPNITIKDTVIVTNNGVLGLTGMHQTAAIVYDTSVIKEIKVNPYSNFPETYSTTVKSQVLFDNNIGILFTNVIYNYDLCFELIPNEDTDYEKTRLVIKSGTIEKGKWYKMGCIPVNMYNSTFSSIVDVDEWQNAGSLN